MTVSPSPGQAGRPTAEADRTGSDSPPTAQTGRSAGRKVGLIDQVAAQLRERIVAGVWPVGERIPTEPELTELVGVGRNTIREAVQSLVHAGLLERRQGSGTYVRGVSELSWVINRELAGARQRDVLEVRQALEIQAAILAARRRTDIDATVLLELQAARAAAVEAGDIVQMVNTDMVLHRFIAQCSQNHLLIQLYESFLDAIAENIRYNFERSDQHADSHAALVDAIVRANSAEAGQEIQDYLARMIETLDEAAGLVES